MKVEEKIPPISEEEKRNHDIHLCEKVQMRIDKEKDKIDKTENKI